MATSSPSAPSTMRAWQYTSTRGGLEKNLHLNPSAPLPIPKADQHLIRILFTALNPVDYKPAEMPLVTRFLSKPITPCIDFVGTIVTPAPTSELKAGQLVFGVAGTTPIAGGALREFAVASTKGTVALPENVSPLDAVTIGVAGLTAYQTIVPRVKSGDKIFINGGSGGTGAFGIQIAKAVGCHVTTTCSTPNVELCKSLGADRVIDYKTEKVVEALTGSGTEFDHAIDNVGTNKELIWRCGEYLKPGAVIIKVAGDFSVSGLVDTTKRKLWPGWMGGMKGTVEGFFTQAKPEQLTRIAEWMGEGKVKAVVDRRFAFEEARDAFERLKTGRARGKIVVDVAGEGSST